MKIILATLVLLLPLMSHADPSDMSANASETAALIKLFSKLGPAYASTMEQGEQPYGAEVECSNANGDATLSTMKCYLRPIAGFSVYPAAAIALDPAWNALMTKMMSQNQNFTYLIAAGFQALGADVRCFDNSDAGDGVTKVPDACTFSSTLTQL